MFQSFAAALAVVAVSMATPAGAAIIQINSRAALSGSAINWAAVGPDLTILSSPFSASGGSGLAFTASGPPQFGIFAGSTYNADFLPSDFVLSNDIGNGNVTAAIRLQFLSSTIMGIGTQINPSLFGSFLATLTAFDNGGNSLGSVTVTGNNQGSNNGSAPFLGLRSTAMDIRAVQFSVTSGNTPVSFAIDSVSLAVPEPGTAPLLILGGVGLAVRRRQTRRG